MGAKDIGAKGTELFIPIPVPTAFSHFSKWSPSTVLKVFKVETIYHMWGKLHSIWALLRNVKMLEWCLHLCPYLLM